MPFRNSRVPLGRCRLALICHVPGVGPDPIAACCCCTAGPGSVFRISRDHPAPHRPGALSAAMRATLFTVVVPSLPGIWPLVSARHETASGVPEMGRLRLRRLMTDVLGYKKVRRTGRATGGARRYPRGSATPMADRMIGIHINLMMVAEPRTPPRRFFPQPIEEEQRYLADLKRWLREGDRLPVDPGHQAADARLLRSPIISPAGLAGMDRGKIPLLVGLQTAPSRIAILARPACWRTFHCTGLPARSAHPFLARINAASAWARRSCPRGDKISVPTGLRAISPRRNC